MSVSGSSPANLIGHLRFKRQEMITSIVKFSAERVRKERARKERAREERVRKERARKFRPSVLPFSKLGLKAFRPSELPFNTKMHSPRSKLTEMEASEPKTEN